MDNTMLQAVLILGAVFVPLSLGAYAIKRIVLAVQRRRRRQAAERILNAPLVAGDYRFRSVAPRVLHVPAATPFVPKTSAIEPEDDRESDLIVPMIVTEAIIRGLGEATIERPEKFEGKGGQAGGAGASGDWAAPEAADEIIEQSDNDTDDVSGNDTTETNES